MKEVLIRSLTGIVFIVLMIGSLLIHELAFSLVLLFFLIISVNEWLMLTEKSGVRLSPGLMFGSSIALFVSFVVFLVIDFPLFIPVFAILLPVIAIGTLFFEVEQVMKKISVTVFGLMYIVLPMGLLTIMNHRNSNFESSVYIISMFVIIWAYDTFAFVSGKLLGKHKLFERISPSKTWEGLIGGSVLTLILVLLVNRYFIFFDHIFVLVATLLIIVFATFGDLFESALKRNAGVKDSGTIFPGHGGVLDRFDSVYFVVFPYLIYLLFVFQ